MRGIRKYQNEEHADKIQIMNMMETQNLMNIIIMKSLKI